MSSRGLIWSTSKSLGFFLLITADQALSRFSLFKSAFNVSSMLDVPHQTTGLWGHRTVTCPGEGAPQWAALWSEVTQWGTPRTCSCRWSLGPSGYSSVPWSTEGSGRLLPWLWATRLQASLQPVSKGSPHHQWSTEKNLQQFLVCTQPYLQLLFEKWTLPTFWGYKKAYLSRSKIFLPTSPVCLQQCSISVFLGSSVHSGSERKAIP